jgi:PTS system mannitol-specific IIC component
MTTASAPATAGGNKARVGIQRFGTFLSGMIMPNIPALIAWGIFTAFFIDVGWTPNADLATLVGPFIHYLLPILIAYTAGHMVYGVRGGVVGSIATFGVIAGSDLLISQFNATLPEGESPLPQINMFLGAMIMGPLAAYTMKQLDRLWDGKIKAGFEMLVNMFSAGIWGFIMAIIGFYPLAWLINGLMNVLSTAVNWLIETGLLPLTSILIEPAKVFFLNNAINHGVLTPLGVEQASENGKSILFLLEANPGPGVGLLLAFTIFGIGAARASAPGAAIIQFFGGIHEVYFPYALMKPTLIIALILGGMTGVTTNLLFGSGLRAPAAPGSILAVLAQTASDSFIGVILSVILSAAVTFIVAAIILRASRKKDLLAEGDEFAAAIAQTEANKGKSSAAMDALRTSTGRGDRESLRESEGAVDRLETEEESGGRLDGGRVDVKQVSNIVFACDAGMGSSAMGASVLRNKIKKAGIEGVTVTNKAIANLDPSADLVITQNQLTDRARRQAPGAIHVSVDNFMNSPKYDEVVNLVADQRSE